MTKEETKAVKEALLSIVKDPMAAANDRIEAAKILLLSF